MSGRNKEFTKRANAYFKKFGKLLPNCTTEEQFAQYAQSNKELNKIINDLEKFNELMNLKITV